MEDETLIWLQKHPYHVLSRGWRRSLRISVLAQSRRFRGVSCEHNSEVCFLDGSGTDRRMGMSWYS